MILQPGQRGSNGRCGSHHTPHVYKRKRKRVMLTEQQIQSVITAILRREGSNSDDPNDLGGETHFGITIPFAGQWHIPWPPTLAEAREGYRRMLQGTKVDQIPDYATFGLVADSVVNHGSAGIKWLQTALGVTADGIIGPITINLMTANLNWRHVYLYILMSRIKFYGHICVNDPSQLKFLNGWLNRACEFLT